MISTKTASKYIDKYVNMDVKNTASRLPANVDAYVISLDRDVIVVMWLGEFRINLSRIDSIRELTKSEEIIFKLRNEL